MDFAIRGGWWPIRAYFRGAYIVGRTGTLVVAAVVNMLRSTTGLAVQGVSKNAFNSYFFTEVNESEVSLFDFLEGQ